MKRFYKAVTIDETADGFRVMLDARPIRTQGGAAQVVPTRELAEAMAEEWRVQGEKINPKSFVLRDLADFAIDHVRPARGAAIDKLLSYAETDTLCYRANPDEPLFQRQQQVWEPLVAACEAAHAMRLERASGIVHRRQPASSMAALRTRLEQFDDFTLAALSTLAPLAASLIVALAAIEEGADAEALFSAANLEEDWQAEHWGWDYEAEEAREAKARAFALAVRFSALARSA